MIGFIRYRKQSYAKILSVQAMNREDYISLGDYCEGGGCKWEFQIVLIRNIGIQIQMFDDAVEALTNEKIVKALISLEGSTTLDSVEEVLKIHKIKEIIK